MTRTIAITGATVAALAACAPPRVAPSHQFLERIYVSKTPDDTSLLFEAQAATHILLVDKLPDAYRRISSGKEFASAVAWRLIATPMFRVRQLKDSSAAVRTPSFMPRLSIEVLRVHRLGRVTGNSSNPVFPGILLLGSRLTVAHHSNGQAGCFRDGFVPVDARANRCIPAAGADTNIVKLNRANGDFSSTFLNLTLHTTLMNRDGAAEGTRSIGLAFGGDYHMPGLFGALSDEQRSLYGSWRARVLGEGMWHFGTTCLDSRLHWNARGVACAFRGRARVSGEFERAPSNPGDLARRIQPRVLNYRRSLEFSHSLDALLGAGPFVRWHDGQDYYNIGFVNRRKVVMFGLMLDASGRDGIHK